MQGHIFLRPIALFIGLTFTGCASVSTQLPDINLPDLRAEQSQQESLAFEHIETLRDRLARVAAPVLKANAELCPKRRKDIGVKTHTLKTYPKALRAAAARELGATSTPTIAYVRPGSTAQEAGIQKGDVLIGKGGVSLSSNDSEFQDGLSLDENTLSIRRGDIFKTVTVKPEFVCGYKVRLSNSTDINAYADGRNITVTSGMINFVQSDAELALIIGHEMGHNTMGHIRKIVGNLLLSALNTQYTRPFESEADYVGMYYLVRAGYSAENVEDFWRRLGAVNPKSVARAKTHPTFPDRYLRIAAARKEIEEKIANDEDLVPNFLTRTSRFDTRPIAPVADNLRSKSDQASNP